ncbi:MFS transporter [Streptomyces sp. GXMU-J15]|uniref:MFS transporter n=1 Tax=Streptomyces fuscus TaxID=3048495 RepID=A0ABT7J4G1_9ACTN|nr:MULTISPECIES: MFS transporter [Streptomyces]MDL2079744.1 MFS transporter [Streptomyces fuscus]SBT90266.1 MFS-type transporter involved in bile tolerance, Atg22 family [Streptomyces sp. DI166]
MGDQQSASEAVRLRPEGVRGSALTLVAAQATTSLGTAVTGFGMNVWVFEETGSFALFATLAVVAALPGLLLAPVAGVVVDRYDRRLVLLVCQGVGGTMLALTLLAALTDSLSPLLVGVLWAVMSTVGAFSWPAVSASITVLSSPERRPKVNGVAETLMGTVTVGSPVLGAALYRLIGIEGIAAFDLVSYAACLGLIAYMRFPRGHKDAGPERGAGGGPRFRDDLREAWRFLSGRRDLLRLLVFFVLVNVGLSMFTVLYSPYVLSFASSGVLGILLSLGGAGTIVAGAVYSATGGPAAKHVGVLAGALLAGLSMAALGLLREPYVLYAVAFLYGTSVPLLNASSQTIWQANVPPELQGRVFSLRRMLAWSMTPVSMVASVPLAERFAAPLVKEGRPAAGIWGTGAAGALGLTATLCGLLCLLVIALTQATGGLRTEGEQPVG